jgi:haloalkane dehalogenase
MRLLRTPDDRFDRLPDYGFEPSYAQVGDTDRNVIRIHAVDAGPPDGPPVLLMHGEPSWSYLYRRMIPSLVAIGCRVLAPDLVGFGRSDKPAEPTDHTYERHVDWMGQWLLGRDLRDITLFCHDWGGLIGLRLVAAFPGRFARVISANTGLPVGRGYSEAFTHWLHFTQSTPLLQVGELVRGVTLRKLSLAEVAAYDAPFPDETYMAGPRHFPAIVPIRPEQLSVAENKAAWKVLETFRKPFLTAFSDTDRSLKAATPSSRTASRARVASRT